MGMTVLAAIGADGNMAKIDFQSRFSQSHAMSNNEMIAETELGNTGISLEGTMLIESMSVSRNESDAIVIRASNVNDVRFVKRAGHNKSVTRRVSVYYRHITRSEDGGVVKSDGSKIRKGTRIWVRLSVVRSL